MGNNNSSFATKTCAWLSNTFLARIIFGGGLFCLHYSQLILGFRTYLIFSGLNRSKCHVDHPSPSSVDVKKEQRYTSASTVILLWDMIGDLYLILLCTAAYDPQILYGKPDDPLYLGFRLQCFVNWIGCRYFAAFRNADIVTLRRTLRLRSSGQYVVGLLRGGAVIPKGYKI